MQQEALIGLKKLFPTTSIQLTQLEFLLEEINHKFMIPGHPYPYLYCVQDFSLIEKKFFSPTYMLPTVGLQ